jgi:nitrite reductase/ring-hydroxylating ferredoxin subunit
LDTLTISLLTLKIDEAKEFNEGACFVVRTQTGVYVYKNRCPHRGTPLNWLPDKFLALDKQLIQCATHGAQFRIEDGFCVWGPCEGACLEKIEVKVEGDKIILPIV